MQQLLRSRGAGRKKYVEKLWDPIENHWCLQANWGYSLNYGFVPFPYVCCIRYAAYRMQHIICQHKRNKWLSLSSSTYSKNNMMKQYECIIDLSDVLSIITNFTQVITIYAVKAECKIWGQNALFVIFINQTLTSYLDNWRDLTAALVRRKSINRVHESLSPWIWARFDRESFIFEIQFPVSLSILYTVVYNTNIILFKYGINYINLSIWYGPHDI